MRHSVFLPTLCLLWSCGTSSPEERWFPVAPHEETFEKQFNEPPITVKIYRNYLESYVVQEDLNEGYVDKYRDVRVRLVIQGKEGTLVDTSFVKEDFIEDSDSALLRTAILQSYWLGKVEGDTVELAGVVGRIESDDVIAFNHRFSLSGRRLTYSEFDQE